MPVDALFESMVGCAAQFGFGQDVASENARLRRRPLHRQPQEGGLKPPLQRAYARFGRVAVSTTKNTHLVVENYPRKSPLKVLVEAFLLAFCPTCRRADIFHNERILGRQDADLAANSVSKPAVSRFSVVFPSDRLLLDLTKEARRAPFHQSKSKRGIS
jgi:hypothetical protein